MPVVPRLIAWEVTRRCNLHCRHCRASAENGPYPNELTLDEAKTLIDDIATIAKPVLILTGGEPLLRADLWEIVAYAQEKGLKPVLGTNATLVDDAVAAQIARSGMPRISVSLDFPTADAHDAFRGDTGAFDAAIRGIRAVRRVGVGVQINTTVTRLNRHLLPDLHRLAVELDVQAFHPFLLVPTGRGADLSGVELTADEYEETLRWVYETQKTSPLQFKPTDAPQYQRIVRQACLREGCPPPVGHGMDGMTRGCLAGTGFCFVSHVGDLQPCGYFDLRLGNVREQPFSCIWAESPVLDDLRHPERLKGKCGACEYKAVCGGCRARALARTGDYLSEEPYCAHVPERQILNRLQSGFPLAERPYRVLGDEWGLSESAAYAQVESLVRKGSVRRLGAFFDSRRLGHVSTLVALSIRPDHLDAVAERLSELPGVTHDYARSGDYNLWFTFIARTRSEIDELVAGLRSDADVLDVMELPALKTYKLRVDFSGSPHQVVQTAPEEISAPFNPDNSKDVALVCALQGDLVERGLRPYDGLDLDRVRELLANGTIRRLGAVVNHTRAGYVANALTAWCVPEALQDVAGGVLSTICEVSHCYLRPARPNWPFNLYAMVHGRSADDLSNRLKELVQKVSEAVGTTVDCRTFETRHEYKKTSMRYFADRHAKGV